MHALSARFGRETQRLHLLSRSSSILFEMTSAGKVSRALNSWAREGQDFLGGGADSHAFQSLLMDYFADDSSESMPLDTPSH